MPSSVPMTIDSSVAVPTSHTVGHSESMITSLTGRLLLIEMPRSPCSVWRTYLTNCTSSGSPTPKRSSSEAICDADRLRPRNRLSTGLSSTTRNRKKLNASTNASVPIAPATLPSTKRAARSRSLLLALVLRCPVGAAPKTRPAAERRRTAAATTPITQRRC